MRESIIIKAWFWQRVLGVAILWCRFCRWLHKHADNLCGWLAMKAGGNFSFAGPSGTDKPTPFIKTEVRYPVTTADQPTYGEHTEV